MISIKDLMEIARLKGINNRGNAEKDYLLDVALLSISRNTKDEFVFKGGTCLYKFYKLNRFSEDLDFTLRKEIDIDALIKKIIMDLNSFGVEAEIKDKKGAVNSIMFVIRAKGPLYTGISRSFSKIGIDINLKSNINVELVSKDYSSLYPDVPVFNLMIMDEREILSEKIRAIMARNYARDVYDLWFLLKKGIKPDLTLINEKLSYYKKTFVKKEFIKKLNEKEVIWNNELEPLIMGSLPDFKTVKKDILESVRKIKK